MFKTIERKTIEQIKNVLLVVLVISAILLLYFFWKDISLYNFSIGDLALLEEEAPAHRAIETEEVMLPDRMVLSFGDGVYTVLADGKERYWKDSDNGKQGMLSCIRSFAESSNVLLEEVGEDVYLNSMVGPSISASFNYYIPFSGFCEEFDIRKPAGADNIDAMSTISYSMENGESLFLHDANANRYYRILAEDGTKNGSLLGQFFADLESRVSRDYVQLNGILGESTTNTTLIPLVLEANLSDFNYQQEFTPSETGKIEEAAKVFFGENFDFIRKIEEASGAVIYMYGYGEKVLAAAVDGSLEYKEEALDPNSQTKYFSGLTTALKFISEHGGAETLDDQPVSLYLKNVYVPQERKKNYRFVFGIQAAGEEIYYQKGEALEVEVSGNQVIYYKRNFMSYEETKLTGATRNGFSAVNMLAQGCEYIYNTLVSEGRMEPIGSTTLGRSQMKNEKMNFFDPVAEQISKLDYGYVRPEQGDTVQAAWIVTLQNGTIEFYFSLDEQEPKPIGYRIN